MKQNSLQIFRAVGGLLMSGVLLAPMVACAAPASPPAAAAAVQGKPAANVTVRRADPAGLLSVGGAQVELEFRTTPNQTLAVSYRTEAGAVVMSSPKTQLLADAHGRVRDTVMVDIREPGVHYLNVFVKGPGGERAVSIRLETQASGPQSRILKPRQPGAAAPAPNGDNVIIMPAQESRR